MLNDIQSDMDLYVSGIKKIYGSMMTFTWQQERKRKNRLRLLRNL